MATVLGEYFGQVFSSDIYDHGHGTLADFLQMNCQKQSVDWVVTNPPFRLAEEFVLRALEVARKGVAIIARTVFLESVGRYERLYRDHPPARFMQFTERVPIVRGRLDGKISTATGYAWLVWEMDCSHLYTECAWIPPCRKLLERPGDYDNRVKMSFSDDPATRGPGK
jgi:hypothetical protein